MIRLRKESKNFYYNGTFRALVMYNHAAGRKNRYEVFLLTSEDPIVIGRELDLKCVRVVLNSFEEEFKKITFFGDRETALKVSSKVWKK